MPPKRQETNNAQRRTGMLPQQSPRRPRCRSATSRKETRTIRCSCRQGLFLLPCPRTIAGWTPHGGKSPLTARVLQHAPLQECGLALKEFLAEFDEAKESFKGSTSRTWRSAKKIQARSRRNATELGNVSAARCMKTLTFIWFD